MARRDDQFIDRRPPLGPQQKELMMVVLIRSRAAFDAVAGQLRPEHFPPQDKKFAILWAATIDYFDAHGKLPAATYLSAEIQQRLDANPEALSDEEIQELDDFVGDYAFKFPRKDLSPNYAIAKARQLLEDSLHGQTSELLNERDTPVDLGRLLGRLRDQAIAISSLDTATGDAFPAHDDWGPKANSIYTTGVDFLDMFLNGGHSPGELYLALGPYGSCKTMLGVQISIWTGHFLYCRWVAEGCVGPCPVTYYMSAEMPLADLRLRAMSNYAKIRRDSIWTREAWDRRSRTGALKEYEIALFGADYPGEVERMAVFQRVLNQFWRPFDLSGADPQHPGRGQGGIDEIAALIRADRAARGNPQVGVVVVDYIQLLAERCVNAKHGGNHDEMRHIVGRMPGNAGDKIAKPFQTPVWLLSQFNKKGNTGKSGNLPTHSEAAEASNLAENCDFAFSIGNKQEGNFCLIGATKSRRAEMQPAIPVQINGQLNAVENMSKDMRVDPASRRIVRKGDLSRVIGDSDDDNQAGADVHFLSGGD